MSKKRALFLICQRILTHLEQVEHNSESKQEALDFRL
jgi:hypothetical protein